MNYEKSSRLYQKSQEYIPGGVNSPVRAFKSVGMEPVFIQKAQGSHIFDVDGNEYIDYVGSWGPMILGHSHPAVIEKVQSILLNGTSFGAPTAYELELAEIICDMVPSVEMVRLVNSGTEATMSAARLARAYTGRDKIIKFEGCYHGHGDSFLIKAGSGAATLGHPSSPGVTKASASDTLIAVFNDIESVKKLFEQYPGKIAALIIEPVAGNMGVVTPGENFLNQLRQLCDTHKSVLIFDEVMTGFRLAEGGAQELYSITPDLTTMGKVIGGGFPIGAYGGKKEIMELIAPSGPVYQAGTLSGNPVAVTAGTATLEILRKEQVIDKINRLSRQFAEGMKSIISSLPLRYQCRGSMGTLFFREGAVNNFAAAAGSNTVLYAEFFKRMLDKGVYLAPSQFEASFISCAHTQDDIDLTLSAARASLKEIFSS